MFSKIEWDISSKYLKSKRKESFITFISWFSLIGIALGVAVLIIVMSVMNGFRKEIVSSIIALSGHVYISSYSGNIKDYKQIADTITNIKEVNAAFPVINQQVLFNSVGVSVGGIISGLTIDNILSKPILQKSLSYYDLSEFKNNKNVVLLGEKLAQSLQLGLGDNITIISPNGYSSVFGSVPKFGSYKIIALLNTGMYQYDTGLAIIPFKAAQSFLNFNDTTQQIEVYLKNYNNADKIKLQLQKELKGYHISNWQDSNKYLIDALIVQRNVLFLILSLVILIASFNIVSGLTMLVKNKTKEISILRTIGLSEGSVIKIFLLIGIRIGFNGTFFGTIVGTIIALNLQGIKSFIEKAFGLNLFPEEVYFLSSLPSDINPLQILFIILLALFFSVLSSLYPALKAARINPADGLKYD